MGVGFLARFLAIGYHFPARPCYQPQPLCNTILLSHLLGREGLAMGLPAPGYALFGIYWPPAEEASEPLGLEAIEVRM